MFDPSWEEGCSHCSFWADNFNKIIVHMNQRDVTMIAVFRAPIASWLRTKTGWAGISSGFLLMTQISISIMTCHSHLKSWIRKKPSITIICKILVAPEREGVSVFYKDPAGRLFHTYSAYARGIDMLNVAYHYLDLFSREETKKVMNSLNSGYDVTMNTANRKANYVLKTTVPFLSVYLLPCVVLRSKSKKVSISI